MTQMLYIQHAGDLQTENNFLRQPPEAWNQSQAGLEAAVEKSSWGHLLSIMMHFKSYHCRLATTSPSHPALSKCDPAIHTYTATTAQPSTVGGGGGVRRLGASKDSKGRFHNAQVVFHFKSPQRSAIGFCVGLKCLPRNEPIGNALEGWMVELNADWMVSVVSWVGVCVKRRHVVKKSFLKQLRFPSASGAVIFC